MVHCCAPGTGGRALSPPNQRVNPQGSPRSWDGKTAWAEFGSPSAPSGMTTTPVNPSPCAGDPPQRPAERLCRLLGADPESFFLPLRSIFLKDVFTATEFRIALKIVCEIHGLRPHASTVPGFCLA